MPEVIIIIFFFVWRKETTGQSRGHEAQSAERKGPSLAFYYGFQGCLFFSTGIWSHGTGGQAPPGKSRCTVVSFAFLWQTR